MLSEVLSGTSASHKKKKKEERRHYKLVFTGMLRVGKLGLQGDAC